MSTGLLVEALLGITRWHGSTSGVVKLTVPSVPTPVEFRASSDPGDDEHDRTSTLAIRPNMASY